MAKSLYDHENKDAPAREDASLLEASSISKTYSRDIAAVVDVSLDIDVGDSVCIIGPSGSGKSTFLRALNVLETPTDGCIKYRDQTVGRWKESRAVEGASKALLVSHRTRVAMVFQQFELFSHLTALKNVALGPRHVLGMSRSEALDLAGEMLDKVGLGDKCGAHPAQLSGGQQQRTAIARALAMQPEVILFDEPTSALDPEMVREVSLTMEQLAQEGRTMVVATHAIDFAANIASHVMMMDQGRVVSKSVGSDALYDPPTQRMRDFLSSLRMAR